MEIIDVSANTANSVMGVGSQRRVGFILHTSSGLDSLRWLQGDSAASGTPASADYLISRNGTTRKLMPTGHYAYHAGEASTTNGTNQGLQINKAYIGIELENNDAHGETPTDIQLQACAEVIRREAQANDMSPIKLYTHANIALPPGRRSDPTRTDIGRIFFYTAHPTPFMLA